MVASSGKEKARQQCQSFNAYTPAGRPLLAFLPAGACSPSAAPAPSLSARLRPASSFVCGFSLWRAAGSTCAHCGAPASASVLLICKVNIGSKNEVVCWFSEPAHRLQRCCAHVCCCQAPCILQRRGPHLTHPYGFFTKVSGTVIDLVAPPRRIATPHSCAGSGGHGRHGCTEI